MFTVIGFMFGGMLLGFLLRRQDMSWIHKVITFLIWMLLFILGIEVGGNQRIIEGLGTIGLEAIVMTLAFVTGSCIFAWGYGVCFIKRKGESHEGQYYNYWFLCFGNTLWGNESCSF